MPFLRLCRDRSDLLNATFVRAVIELLKKRIAEGYRLFVWCCLPFSSSMTRKTDNSNHGEIDELVRSEEVKNGVDKMIGLLLFALRSLPREFVVTAFAWPRRADAWKRPSQILVHLRLFLPLTFDFDGCNYGWRSKMPMRVITDFLPLGDSLSLRCRNGTMHHHTADEGRTLEVDGHGSLLLAEAIADAVCNAAFNLVVAATDQIDAETEHSSVPATSSTDLGTSEVPDRSPLE